MVHEPGHDRSDRHQKRRNARTGTGTVVGTNVRFHGRFPHQGCQEQGHHVPWMVRYPRNERRTRRPVPVAEQGDQAGAQAVHPWIGGFRPVQVHGQHVQQGHGPRVVVGPSPIVSNVACVCVRVPGRRHGYRRVLRSGGAPLGIGQNGPDLYQYHLGFV